MIFCILFSYVPHITLSCATCRPFVYIWGSVHLPKYLRLEPHFAKPRVPPWRDERKGFPSQNAMGGRFGQPRIRREKRKKLDSGAGNGNRTRILSLGRIHSATEPYPRAIYFLFPATSQITSRPMF